MRLQYLPIVHSVRRRCRTIHNWYSTTVHRTASIRHRDVIPSLFTTWHSLRMARALFLSVQMPKSSSTMAKRERRKVPWPLMTSTAIQGVSLPWVGIRQVLNLSPQAPIELSNSGTWKQKKSCSTPQGNCVNKELGSLDPRGLYLINKSVHYSQPHLLLQSYHYLSRDY
jgi:hypothetical protein